MNMGGCRLLLRLPKVVSLAILLGCASGRTAPDMAGSSSGDVGATAAGPSSLGTGWLRVEVRWPRRSLPGFAAQAIPLRTRSIRLTTLDAANTLVDSRLLPRESGNQVASGVTLALPAATGYGLTAEAFEEASPSAATEPIAIGTAAGVFIRKSKVTAVPITLTAVHAPAITSLSPGQGPYGTSVILAGTNFGQGQALPLQVTFNGRQANAVRETDSRIVTAVPVGATTGNVVVTVDGIPSTSVALFIVNEGLDPEIVPADSLPNGLDVDLSSVTTDQGLEVNVE